MPARMKNPAVVIPDAMVGIQHLVKAMSRSTVPQQTLELVALRAGQINGWSVCVLGHVRTLGKAGESAERLATVAAWRDAPFFTDVERAALALAESATRLADHPGDSVPDEIWDEAAAHYDEQQLAGLVLMIATINFLNRLNVTVREQADGPSWA